MPCQPETVTSGRQPPPVKLSTPRRFAAVLVAFALVALGVILVKVLWRLHLPYVNTVLGLGLGCLCLVLAMLAAWRVMSAFLYKVGRRLSFSYFLIGVLPIPMVMLLLVVVAYLLACLFVGHIYRDALQPLDTEVAAVTREHAALFLRSGQVPDAPPPGALPGMAFAYYRDGKRTAGDPRPPARRARRLYRRPRPRAQPAQLSVGRDQPPRRPGRRHANQAVQPRAAAADPGQQPQRGRGAAVHKERVGGPLVLGPPAAAVGTGQRAAARPGQRPPAHQQLAGHLEWHPAGLAAAPVRGQRRDRRRRLGGAGRPRRAAPERLRGGDADGDLHDRRAVAGGQPAQPGDRRRAARRLQRAHPGRAAGSDRRSAAHLQRDGGQPRDAGRGVGAEGAARERAVPGA